MIDVKLQLLMTIVFPVLLYATGTWTVNKEDEKRLLAFEMRCYRRILSAKLQDRRTNEEIRAVVQRKETVVDTIRNINYCVRGGHKPARWPWRT